MTIVSGPDHRNSDWANDKSSFGQKMLLKMGWKEGKGLGKNQQGTSTNLRAIRREENLGIGAKTDTVGEEGFTETSKNFHGILAALKEEHGDSSSNKISKKEKKRRKKDKEKRDKSESFTGVTLSSKRVTAGHAKKMRDAKDLSKKSKEDMAAIFGVRVEEYQNNSVWGKLSSLSTSGDTSESAVEEKKENISVDKKSQKKDRKKKDKKKRKKKENHDGVDRKRRKKSSE